MVLDDVNLYFDKGILGILGENGAGKSTLLKILAFLIKQSEGEVNVSCGKEDALSKLKNKVVIVTQDEKKPIQYKSNVIFVRRNNMLEIRMIVSDELCETLQGEVACFYHGFMSYGLFK